MPPRVPCPESLRGYVRGLAGRVAEAVLAAIGDTLPASAAEFAALEGKLSVCGARDLAAPVLGEVLAHVSGSAAFVEHAVKTARAERPLKIHSHRDVNAQVEGGEIRTHTPYATPPPPPTHRPGRRRGVGRRGPTGNGCYPVLAQLGFLGRVSPGLTSAVARAATELASYVEARESLAARGIDLDAKTVRYLTHRIADAGLEARLAEDVEHDRVAEELKGKRVVVTFDAGRLRTRVSGKRGRRRATTGARRYDTPWRAPALLAVYTVDADGNKTAERPWYEATLDGWNALFSHAVRLLRRLGVQHAAELVVAADGENAIWDRVEPLLLQLGIDRARVHLFVDFWHAVEYLTKAAELVGSWSAEQRARWRRARRRELFDGKVELVIERIEELAIGRRAAPIKEIAAYFRKRRDLMRYDALRRAKLPIGTGAVESAIRRVINLRIKAPGTFWEEQNAERMLLLRCRLKSGRWEELEQAAFARASAPHGRVLALERRARKAG